MTRIIRNRKEIQEALAMQKVGSKQPIPDVMSLSRREFKARYGAKALANTPEEQEYQTQRRITGNFRNNKPQSKYNY